MTHLYNKKLSRILSCFMALLLSVCLLIGNVAVFSANSSESVIVEAPDRVLAEGEKCNLLWGVTAKTSSGKSLLGSLTITVNGGSTEIERTFDEGSYAVKYAVEYEGQVYEKAVTFTVSADSYIDITPPVILGVGDQRVLTGTNVELLSGVTAIDEADGDVASKLSVTVNGETASGGNYKFTKEGEYALVYTVKDSGGNTQTKEAVVTVSDEAYDLAYIENAIGTTDRHDLTTATVISRETEKLYTGKTGNGNKVNEEAVRITHSKDTHAFTYFYLGDTFDDYTDLTLGKGIEFYIYYSASGSKAVNVALGGGAERRSIRVNAESYQTAVGDGWYKVTMPFEVFCASESMLASTGETNAVILHLTCSDNSDYFIIDELTLIDCTAAIASPVIAQTDSGIAWDEVENAGKYEIYNNGELLDTVKSASYSLSKQPSGFYNLTVVAVPSDAKEYYSSAPSNELCCVNIIAGQKVPLEAPVIARDFHSLEWELSGYAAGYTLYVDGKAVTTLGGNVDTVDLSSIITDTKSHEVYLVANGDNDMFSDSKPSNKLSYSNIGMDTEADDLSSKLSSDYGIDMLEKNSFEHTSENSLYGLVASGTIAGSTKYSGLKYEFEAVDDFSEVVITMDVKFVSNCDRISLKLQPTPDGGSSSAYQVTVGKSGADGIKVTDLGNGYYRYTVNCGEAFAEKGGCEDVSSFRIIFSNSLDPQLAATIAVDNLHIDIPASIAKPKNVTVSGEAISWSSVDGAAEYEIYANGEKLATASGTSYVFTHTKTGVYSITVRAVASDGLISRDSDPVSITYVLPGDDYPLSPAVITLSGSELSWKAVDNAKSYQVLADGKKLWEGTSLYCDLSKAVTSTGSVKITVAAIGKEGYGDSVSDSVTYFKAEAVDLTNIMEEGYNVDDLTLDTSVHSEDSTQSLKASTKTEKGKAKYANVLYNFPETVSLEGAIISFDFKEGNDALGGTISLRVVAGGTQLRFDIANLSFTDLDSSLYTVKKLSNGFIRVTVKGEAFDGIGMDEAVDLDFGFSNSDSEGDGYSTAGIVYFDNVTLTLPDGLSKSKLSIEEGVLTFTAVNDAKKYEIYVDSKLVKTVTASSASSYTYDLGKLSSGSHTVSVKAIASGEVNPSTATVSYNPDFSGQLVDLTKASVIARDAAGVAMGSADISSAGGYKDSAMITALLTKSDADNASDINRFGMKITLGDLTFTGGNTIGVYAKAEGYDLAKYGLRLQYKNGSEYIFKDLPVETASDGWFYCEIEIDSSMTAKGTEMYVFVSQKYATGNVTPPVTLKVSSITIK